MWGHLIDGSEGGGAWCPIYAVNTNGKEWIKVVLEMQTRIAQMQTQGRWANGRGESFHNMSRFSIFTKALEIGNLMKIYLGRMCLWQTVILTQL